MTTQSAWDDPRLTGKLPPPPAHVLKGPADADHYRIKVGRFGDRHYVDPLPACDIAPATDAAWPSVTTVKKASGQDWSFVALGRVADCITEDPRQFDKLDRTEVYDRLKTLDKKAKQVAFDRGTGVHYEFEYLLRTGRGYLKPGDPGYDYVPAIHAFFDREQPELVAAELVCIHRDLNGAGYAGASDGVVKLNTQGGTWLVDWKSRKPDGDHAAYPEEKAQIGAYARAQYLIAEGANGPERQRIPALDGGAIVSIRPDGYRVFPIDLDKAMTHFTALHAWWVALRSEKDGIGKPWAPRGAQQGSTAAVMQTNRLVGDVQAATTVEELSALAAQAFADGLWTDPVRELFSARKAALTGAAA